MAKKRINYFFKITIGCLAISLLPNCSSNTGPIAEKHPEGVWLGQLVTEQGKCPTERLSALRIEKKVILFSPENGAIILRGHYNKKAELQHFSAQFQTTDANHKPYNLIFGGYPKGNVIIGDYGTPDCRAHIIMHPPRHYGWSEAIPPY